MCRRTAENSKEKVKSGCSLEGLLEVEVTEGKKCISGKRNSMDTEMKTKTRMINLK